MPISAETPMLSAAPMELLEPIIGWGKWLEYWKNADCFEWRKALLLTGFDIPFWSWSDPRNGGNNTWCDRVLVYLNVANGHRDENLLRNPQDRTEKYFVSTKDPDDEEKAIPARRVRQRLARVAFAMLAKHFFPMKYWAIRDSEYHYYERWEEMVLHDSLYLDIPEFFRVTRKKDERCYRVHNLPGLGEEQNHKEREAIEFLLNFARFLWGWKEEEYPVYRGERTEIHERYEEKRRVLKARIEMLKPWMIEVLAALKRLDVVRRWVTTLGEPCIAKLTSIALEYKLDPLYHPVMKYPGRQVRDLDEAVYAGSHEARFVQEHYLKSGAEARLIAEAKEAAAAKGQ